MPPAKLKRGGARNRANRCSQQLTQSACEKLIGASFAALDARMPLNRFITIGWELGGIAASESVEATGRFVRLAREWCHARGYPMPWIWVQECGNRFGQHAHILFHVAPDLEALFRPMPLRWTKTILPHGYIRGVVQSQRLRLAYSTNTEAYCAELLGKLHYMLKCAPTEVERKLEMIGCGHKLWGQSSIVVGKRSGVWQGWKSYKKPSPKAG